MLFLCILEKMVLLYQIINNLQTVIFIRTIYSYAERAEILIFLGVQIMNDKHKMKEVALFFDVLLSNWTRMLLGHFASTTGKINTSMLYAAWHVILHIYTDYLVERAFAYLYTLVCSLRNTICYMWCI